MLPAGSAAPFARLQDHFRRLSTQASCARIYTREGHIAAKKHAKVRLFFDIAK